MIRFLIIDYSRSPVDSIREAVLIVSPNKQYLGIVVPMVTVSCHYKILEFKTVQTKDQGGTSHSYHLHKIQFYTTQNI